MGRGVPQINRVTVPLLINEVKKRRCLWDPANENYQHRYYIGLAWKQIATKLKTSELRAKMRWKNLRDTFFRTAKRLNDSTNYPTTWLYYHDLLFLKPSAATPNDEYETEYLISEDSGSSINGMENDGKLSNDKIKYSNDDDSTKGNDKTTTKEWCNASQASFSRDHCQTADEEHDLMFLESLAPFFCKLDPMRKLILRSRIQDMLLNEVASHKNLSVLSADIKKKEK